MSFNFATSKPNSCITCCNWFGSIVAFGAAIATIAPHMPWIVTDIDNYDDDYRNDDDFMNKAGAVGSTLCPEMISLKSVYINDLTGWKPISDFDDTVFGPYINTLNDAYSKCVGLLVVSLLMIIATSIGTCGPRKTTNPMQIILGVLGLVGNILGAVTWQQFWNSDLVNDLADSIYCGDIVLPGAYVASASGGWMGWVFLFTLFWPCCCHITPTGGGPAVASPNLLIINNNNNNNNMVAQQQAAPQQPYYAPPPQQYGQPQYAPPPQGYPGAPQYGQPGAYPPQQAYQPAAYPQQPAGPAQSKQQHAI